ncbi:MAG: hypothetical protein MZU84_05465 [Sphingobacterium sp.]|nr:hypothetical protein [Sphingobacterium sp.]
MGLPPPGATGYQQRQQARQQRGPHPRAPPQRLGRRGRSRPGPQHGDVILLRILARRHRRQ